MSISIDRIKGISVTIAERLKERGLNNDEKFLVEVRTPKERKALAEALGIDAQTILELANRADLARIRGIGSVFSDLLEEAGVDTVKELATRNPDNLYAKLVEINAKEQLVGRVPSLNAVKQWVAHAKILPPGIEY